MKIDFYPDYERKLQQLIASDDLEWELIRPKDGDIPLLDQIKTEISKVRKQRDDPKFDTSECHGKLNELAYWVVRIKTEVGLPVSPDEMEACPVSIFEDGTTEFPKSPIVEDEPIQSDDFMVKPAIEAFDVRNVYAAYLRLIASEELSPTQKRKLRAVLLKYEGKKSKEIFAELQPDDLKQKDPSAAARRWVREGRQLAKTLGLSALID